MPVLWRWWSAQAMKPSGITTERMTSVVPRNAPVVATVPGPFRGGDLGLGLASRAPKTYSSSSSVAGPTRVSGCAPGRLCCIVLPVARPSRASGCPARLRRDSARVPVPAPACRSRAPRRPLSSGGKAVLAHARPHSWWSSDADSRRRGKGLRGGGVLVSGHVRGVGCTRG